MKHKQHNKIKATAALLAGTLALGILAGCAQHASEPVITQDDLTPSSAAQEVLEEDFAYFWLGEAMEKDPERVEQIVLRSVQANEQFLRDLLQSEELTEDNKAVLMAELERFEDENNRDATMQELQKEAQEQQEYDPVISPQEAANRAGLLFEQLYGIDLTGTEIYITCNQHQANGDYTPFGGRMIWETVALNGPLEKLDMNGQRLASCTLDATTGEFIQASYTFTDQELAAMQNTPIHEAYMPGYYQWDTQHPKYTEVTETMRQQLTEAFSGCMFADGAAVTDAEQIQDTYTCLTYRLCCDNGRNYELLRRTEFDPYTQYDFGGYPLRACYIQNEAYYQ